jgi:hypothetical protein
MSTSTHELRLNVVLSKVSIVQYEFKWGTRAPWSSQCWRAIILYLRSPCDLTTIVRLLDFNLSILHNVFYPWSYWYEWVILGDCGLRWPRNNYVHLIHGNIGWWLNRRYVSCFFVSCLYPWTCSYPRSSGLIKMRGDMSGELATSCET